MIHDVAIRDFAFYPERLTICVGDSVQWTNHDNVRHSAKRTVEPSFATRRLARGETSEPITFDTASDATGYSYFCDPHSDMVGSIIVNEKAR